jgi:hypothetical protein
MTAHQLPDVTVVADAGVVPESNQQQIDLRSCRYPGHTHPGRPLRGRPVAPRASRQGHPRRPRFHPALADRPTARRRDRVIYYQYRADRALASVPRCRTLRGTGEQIAKAEQAVAGKTAVKRKRFVQLSGGAKSVNRQLETKDKSPGRAEGLHHQSRCLPERHAGHRGVRDRRLPPAILDRKIPSGYPRATCRPGPSTTAIATPSKPTRPSSSQRWRSAAGSRTRPAGRSGSSSARTPLPQHRDPGRPPPTPCPTTSATPSKHSPAPTDLRTNGAQLGYGTSLHRRSS